MKKVEDAYEGKIVGGRVEWKDGRRPPEGSRVRAELRGNSPRTSRRPARTSAGRKQTSVWELMKLLAGTATGLPRDLARNHDHYIHGAPKK